MKVMGLCGLGLLLFAAPLPLTAAMDAPHAVATQAPDTRPAAPQDGVRPEDVMIDDDAIGDVWDTASPADAIGISARDANMLPVVTSGLSSAEMLAERDLLRPVQPDPEEDNRTPTRRWRPAIPIQTLFYLGLAVVVVVVLLLKARG
ncbi:MAG: hypothetical protein HN919_00800 [Verrucomicrobia bacterium]|nr:hypothetical protein [Verrucomicrobiota bacterium]MBT7064817.1 hypothetical protein [Verrucomicrobiota bacterium]MBT7701209.1 hypothetical protein [Verrucomicrobiota bacterium]